MIGVFVVKFQLKSKFNNNNNNNNNNKNNKNKTKICQFICQVSPKPPLRRKIGIVTKSLETHGPQTLWNTWTKIDLEPQTTIYKWMFGETTIFYIKI